MHLAGAVDLNTALCRLSTRTALFRTPTSGVDFRGAFPGASEDADNNTSARLIHPTIYAKSSHKKRNTKGRSPFSRLSVNKRRFARPVQRSDNLHGFVRRPRCLPVLYVFFDPTACCYALYFNNHDGFNSHADGFRHA